MATYSELYNLRSDSALRNKVAVAVVIKAQLLLDGATPTTDQVNWANAALLNPIEKANQIFNYVLAANNSQTVSTIQNATDSAIQTNVDSAADALIAQGII